MQFSVDETSASPGTIVVFDDMRSLREQVAVNILIIAFAAFVAVSVAYVLALRLRNVVASPVLALTEAAQSVAHSSSMVLRSSMSTFASCRTL